MRRNAIPVVLVILAACGESTKKNPPDTAFDTLPAALSNQKHVEIGFHPLGNANTFLCKLDSASETQCVPPFVADIADGAHTFSVAAALNDAVDETPASYSWTIDTVPPETTLISGPPVLDNTLMPVVEFNGTDNNTGAVTFECALDGAAFAACTSPTTVNTVDGAHTFVIRAKDAAGNIDDTPVSIGWTVDSRAPDTAITSGPDDGSTSAAAVSFSFATPGNDPTVTFECSRDSAAFAACTSPQTFTLGDGAHAFTVRAKSQAGLVDPSPAQVDWTVDATAPPVSITSNPSNPSNDATPSFAFSSTDATATFECRVDAGAFAACASPFDAASIVDGSHTFAVRATDPVGNNSSASFAWVVDTVAPVVAITAAPPAFTNDNTPTVAFTTTGGATAIACSVDGGAFAACTSPFTATALGEGAHTITIHATDAATNTGTATASFTVDTLPPTVTITSGPPAATNDTTPTFAFATTGATATDCRLDTGAFAPCTSPITTAALADGSHTFTVRATDAATNTATASATFTVDTVPPTIAITAAPPVLSNDATPSVSFTAGGGATQTECQVDGGAFAACISPFTSAAVADGSHTITVRARDAAGNTATASTTFTVDTTPPTVAITGEPSALGNDNTPTVTFTTGGSPTSTQCRADSGAFASCTSPFTAAILADGSHTITVRVTDGAGNSDQAITNTFVIDTVPPTVSITTQPAALSNDATPSMSFTTGGGATTTVCRVDSGAFAACTSPFTSAALADGSHTMTVQATDDAGNSATATTASFTIDTAPPSVTITAQPSALSNDTTPSVSFTVTGATTIQCQVDAGTFATCTSPFTSAALTDGTHTITVRGTDAASNSASATTNVFTIDTVPPTVSITSQPAALSNDNTPAMTFTTGNGAVSTQCRVDSGTFAACTSPFTAAAVTDGAHTMTVQATDGAGNTATATTTSFTVDTAPPTVTFTGQPAALSNDTTPTASFTTAGGAVTIECRVDAGTFAACTSPFTSGALVDGSHTITVRATDGANNTGSATTSAFTIDTVPPTVTITGQPAALSNDTTPTVTFTTAGGATSTACQVDTGSFASCTSPFTSAALADGLHTITVRAIDGAGNNGTATTNVFTIDTVGPTVAITGQPAALSNDNTPTITFTTGGGATATTCRVDSGTAASCTSPFTSTALGDGAHTITVTATDGAGNPASATTSPFTIDTAAPSVVLDDVPPALWPVNYFDMKFHATETAALTCSLNGSPFASCATNQTFTTAYNTASTFTVHATDAAGNVGSASATWTSIDGLVLHYPYEQGATNNTSLLAQNPAYSPDGSVAALPFLGGWAGTALGNSISAHGYSASKRPLQSAAQPGNYTGSFWVRPNNDIGNGTIMSTLGTSGGFRLRILGLGLTVEVLDPATGQLASKQVSVGLDRWTNVALRATGPGKGLEVWLNGNLATVVTPPVGTGFDPGMADLTVGPVGNIDLDDVRFYNRTLSNAEMCGTVARGFTNANGACVPLAPGFEFDFEANRVFDTGAWKLPTSQPQGIGFAPTKTGNGLRLPFSAAWGPVSGFQAQVNALPPSVGRSFSFWFDSTSNSIGNLLSFRAQCSAGGPPIFCGMQLQWLDSHELQVFVGNNQVQKQTNIPVPPTGMTSVVVTEARNAAGVTTQVQVFVNGALAVVFDIGVGDVYKGAADSVQLVAPGGMTVDEYSFWTTDLAKNPEALCENGFGGEFDPATNNCSLTSN